MRLYAGFGESDITPPLGVELSGYGYYLERRALTTYDPLRARALCLRDEARTLLIVACDLIGFSVEQSDALRADLAEIAETPRDHVLLACTHTHTGPATISLEGIGVPDEDYLATLPGRIAAAARAAVADLAPATARQAFQVIEPVGFNRRNGSFHPIDPFLRVLHLDRDGAPDVWLLNYSCHAVSLGARAAVCADWPGALARSFGPGERALVLQGFCGDIDPADFLNAWGGGSPTTIADTARLMAERARRALTRATGVGAPRLTAVETRAEFPLSPVPPDVAGEELNRARQEQGEDAPICRFLAWWVEQVERRFGEVSASPRLSNVPLQALAVGGFRLVGLPGEVFSEYVPKLEKKWGRVVPVGYANGDAGYLPTREAYEVAGDYACYLAPRFYATFPFTPDVEDRVLAAADRLLESLPPSEAALPAGPPNTL